MATYRDWPDGRAHTIPYAQHLANVRAQRSAAQGAGAGMGAGSTSALKALQAAQAGQSAAPTPQAPAAPDPRDSTFSGGVNQLIFNNTNQRNALVQQGKDAEQDFNTLLTRLADSRAKDLLETNHGANQQGLFYSGQLGKRRDDVSKTYDQQQGDAQSSYDRAKKAREDALAQLGTITADPNSPLGYTATGQAGIDLASLFGDAVGRRSATDASGAGDLAAAGASPPPAPAAGSPASAPAIKIAASAEHGGAKWVYHRGASGKWIPVRPA